MSEIISRPRNIPPSIESNDRSLIADEITSVQGVGRSFWLLGQTGALLFVLS